MKSLAARIVEAAANAVGLEEKGGPNKGPPVDLFAGGRQEPWCAHFAATLFRDEGCPLPGDIEPTRDDANPIANVKQMWRRLNLAGLAVEVPLPGDVIIFNSRGDSDQGGGWHCGIVSVVDGEHIQTIEGNSGDKVARRLYRVTDSRIAGYGRQKEP